MEERLKIAIIGGGNVASHLREAFRNKAEIAMVNPRTMEGLPENPDLILICVKDDAIAEVVKALPATDAVIAHTSGSIPLSELSETFEHCGVFYPLQTFTKGIELDYSEIPVFIEATDIATDRLLKKAASLFTDSIHEAGSEKRRKLHLASVFVCNFTNALAGIGWEIMGDAGIDSRTLVPLMGQTIEKLKKLAPSEAQTGPAARGDEEVINKHLAMLKDSPEIASIYSSLSDLIKSKKQN